MQNKGKTAVLVDGSFFLNCARMIWGKKNPEDLAKVLVKYCMAHVKHEKRELHRIFYYDCPSAELTSHNPVSGKQVFFNKSQQSLWRVQFYYELKRQRKLALRMGVLDTSNPTWRLSGDKLVKLCKGTLKIDDITENDVKLDIRQKGVDMKIGLDIASVSFKRQVDQIILIAGDSDFVPAAKIARREGVDFFLDPMWLKIKDNLFEHIDGLCSMVLKNPDGTINPTIGRTGFTKKLTGNVTAQKVTNLKNGGAGAST